MPEIPRWEKLGQIFFPRAPSAWMQSYANCCVAVPLTEGRVRVYFSTRDGEGRYQIAYLEMELKDTARILRVSEQPVLGPGEIGTFDDSGCSLGCIVPGDPSGEKDLRLYYIGWNLCVTVPYRNAIGLAVSRDGGETFTRHSPAPILDRSLVDPYTLSYPCVLRDGGRYRMWYGSNLRWGARSEDMLHVIKYAESADGIRWQAEGKVAIPLVGEGEIAVARPCVVRDPDLYRMWYTCLGHHRQIGYAESPDGERWVRRDADGGLVPSERGWDAECVGYPFVFDHNGRRYMLYNGNGYGKTGFGIAVLEA
jgi:hypothetical protein